MRPEEFDGVENVQPMKWAKQKERQSKEGEPGQFRCLLLVSVETEISTPSRQHEYGCGHQPSIDGIHLSAWSDRLINL